MTDGLWSEEMPLPWLSAEVVLAPEVRITAGWRTGGIPITLSPDITSRVPVLEVITTESRLVVGFDPYVVLDAQHAALAGQFAVAADALALEVSLYARAGTTARGSQAAAAEPPVRAWVVNVHLRPGQTRVRMDPCEGDVPQLDFLTGEAVCSVGLAADVGALRTEHADVTRRFATAAATFARDVRSVVQAARRPDPGG